MSKKISLKIGILMDSIESINIKKDSSFAILLEAQKRNHIIHYMEMNDLYLRKEQAFARTRLIKLIKNTQKWYQFIKQQSISLSELDVILMRKDPPFNTEFIYSTYILERAEETGVLIINKPKSLRDCNEKIFTSWFPDLITDTLVTRNIFQIRQFWEKYQDIIIKPLDAMGGSNIFRIKKNDPNFSVIVENMTNYERKYCMVQNYLPEIKLGDKRILIINGKPIPWCVARIARIGETRANLAAGGEGKIQSLSETDWKIANYLSPTLKKRGLILVGLDVIGDKLTEINVTSPTCICEIESQKNISITGMLLDYIEKKVCL
ncbi:glutathione synthase [Buchnera aphidicola]|uniref:glutathione synthase n=1 Tax=Buchnera aphidicola TaxID=9 RepID=UPI000189C617|nr:glutathione synthase [Buchnera aphidicola]ADP66924.1 glutathione synthetase [Buchnera aphidicola str. TLW03 (Acyrthosiphon pisum)]ADP68002.1 glutathione synthetase [Buchnera aphidicola str. JF98 (Acyrthosiphon pisum)]ACL30336.1 glutathione synthetase [Buchnera aphidicola str. Tuc7 (Acyrthosiphon pisum)]ADP66350.1 glutathione synthetase [Buchnera aphidicola str. LL01 (Acyrthosiphon pisum)]ADP67512.1 glutathione synthetase [Buchnera aphidicola str. JF99 (Acyrthosiphon pisum)]